MNELAPRGFEALPYESAACLSAGGILTGSPELASDIGRVIGWAIGSYMQVGRAFYGSGGLTGNNPWKDKMRF